MTHPGTLSPRILLIGLCFGASTTGCSQDAGPQAEVEDSAQQEQVAQRSRPTERRRAQPVIKARALSLSEMTTSAARIVQGIVRDVTEQDQNLEGKNGVFSARVQIVEIDLKSVIKGPVDPDELFVVRQYASLAQFVQPGEEILWYLPDESELGLSAPLGVYSGHFKVVDDKSNPGEQVVLNLASNKGLWSGDSIWSGAGLTEDQFQKTLSAQSEGVEYTRLMQFASRPYRMGPVPLKLVTTASAAIVEESP
jgi:hypothetical protein